MKSYFTNWPCWFQKCHLFQCKILTKKFHFVTLILKKFKKLFSLIKPFCTLVWKQVSRNLLSTISDVFYCQKMHSHQIWLNLVQYSASNKLSFKSVKNWNCAGPQKLQNRQKMKTFWIVLNLWHPKRSKSFEL